MLTINDIITILSLASEEGLIDPQTFVSLLGRFNTAISLATASQTPVARTRATPTSVVQAEPTESRRRASPDDLGVVVIPNAPLGLKDEDLPVGKVMPGEVLISRPRVLPVDE